MDWQERALQAEAELIALKSIHLLEADPANFFEGEAFTLSELREVHQKYGNTMTRDTFNRKALAYVEPTGERIETGGRPATLYRKKTS